MTWQSLQQSISHAPTINCFFNASAHMIFDRYVLWSRLESKWLNVLFVFSWAFGCGGKHHNYANRENTNQFIYPSIVFCFSLLLKRPSSKQLRWYFRTVINLICFDFRDYANVFNYFWPTELIHRKEGSITWQITNIYSVNVYIVKLGYWMMLKYSHHRKWKHSFIQSVSLSNFFCYFFSKRKIDWNFSKKWQIFPR